MTNPVFATGDTVRVKALFPPGHVRTPFYCRGNRGRVERVIGPYPNPEQLAYGERAPDALVLYRVTFPQGELWDDYEGDSSDVLELELYETWLEQDEDIA